MNDSVRNTAYYLGYQGQHGKSLQSFVDELPELKSSEIIFHIVLYTPSIKTYHTHLSLNTSHNNLINLFSLFHNYMYMSTVQPS